VPDGTEVMIYATSRILGNIESNVKRPGRQPLSQPAKVSTGKLRDAKVFEENIKIIQRG
jgi:hypothetical protein